MERLQGRLHAGTSSSLINSTASGQWGGTQGAFSHSAESGHENCRVVQQVQTWPPARTPQDPVTDLVP